MLSTRRQVRLRKVATILAVFACLLIGTIGGDVLALCVGDGHVAVELSLGSHGGEPTMADHLLSPSDKDCVDATLLTSARVERPSGSGLQQVNGKVLSAAAVRCPHATAPPAAGIGWPPAQISSNPALKHHRTVVLLN